MCLSWSISIFVTHNFAQNVFLIYTGFSASNGGHFPVYSTTLLPFLSERLTHIFAKFAFLTHIFAEVADLCVK
jgi:hypothetical protein